MGYETFPILSVARKAGLDVRDAGRRSVQVNCPFCGDRKRRLYLYTDSQQYHCFHCKAHGNAVSLYARRTGLTYATAYRELKEDSVLHFPQPAVSRPPEREPAPLAQRNAVYRALLGLLPLAHEHYDDLRGRGLTDKAIRQNGYRSLDSGKELRDDLAARLSVRFDLNGIPGFFFDEGRWRMSAYSGLLVPVRAVNGQIQGIQIRLDHADTRKYRWMSSTNKPSGTGARSWIHVAGDRSRPEVYITEGPIKGDVSSLLTGGALFVCVPGVTATAQLPETLRSLGVKQAFEALDMDKLRNPQVSAARKRLRQMTENSGIPCKPLLWDPAYKGIDDYLAAQAVG